MAAGLARFVAEADAHRGVDGLPRRSPPPEGALWGKPHNALFDFEATVRGAERIDEVARSAQRVMRRAGSRYVVGHSDWRAGNMRMGPDGIAVLYDWDSVFLDREAFVVGNAAANFRITSELDVPTVPAAGEVAAFVREYEAARGTPFTPSELAEVEAGTTYLRAYAARCEHAIDPEGARWRGSWRESLERDGPYRLRPGLTVRGRQGGENGAGHVRRNPRPRRGTCPASGRGRRGCRAGRRRSRPPRGCPPP